MAPRRRNPEGARVLRAISALLVVDDMHRHRLPPRAWTSPRQPRARGPVEFYHGLPGVTVLVALAWFCLKSGGLALVTSKL